MKRLILLIAAACALAVSTVMGGEPIRVLIVDGFGNHDWRRTTRMIRGILDTRAEFRTDVITAPGSAAEPGFTGWTPDFSRFEVVIQTCNDIHGSGPLWPEGARRGLESFVAGGGGLFVFHSANNAFAQWSAYNEMIGLGWRPKEFGTAIRILEDGSLERIAPGKGAATGHGARSDRLIHRRGEHPMHAGLPRVWMTPLIEVYTHARGPAERVEILSWAEDPAGEGRWPVEWTVAYGKGRIYTSTFGHVWNDEVDPVGMRCAGFQTVFIRALQWLAKREIEHGTPADFPTAAAISLRPMPVPRSP